MSEQPKTRVLKEAGGGRSGSVSSHRHTKSSSSDQLLKPKLPPALNKAAAVISADESRKPSKSLSTANFKVIEEHVTADKKSTMNLFNDATQSVPPTPTVDNDAASIYTHSILESTFIEKKDGDDDEEFVYEATPSTPVYPGGHNNSSYTNMPFFENERPNLLRKTSVRSTAGVTPAGLGIAPLSTVQKSRQPTKPDNESILSQKPPNLEILNHQKRVLNAIAANNASGGVNKRLPNIILNQRQMSKADSVIHNTDAIDDDDYLSDNGSYSVGGSSPVHSRFMSSATSDHPNGGNKLEKYALMYNNDNLSMRASKNAAKALIVSQVRKVSDKLFNSRPQDFRRRKISLESMESYPDEFEEDPLLNYRGQGVFYENYGSTSNGDLYMYNDLEPWGKYPQYPGYHSPSPRHVPYSSDINYRNFTNPHDYKTSKSSRYTLYKIVLLLLRLAIWGFLAFALVSIFVMQYMDSPLLDFNVDKISKLIVTEEMLVFDLNTMSRNINLQDITITESNLDVFIQTAYLNEDTPEASGQSDTTILVGNIQSFIIPLKFSGIINHVAELSPPPLQQQLDDSNLNSQFTSVWYLMHHRNKVGFSKSTAQIRLSKPPGYYQELVANATQTSPSSGSWKRVINNPFTLIVRGSLNYQLPLKGTADVISVSKSSKFGPGDNNEY